MIERINRIKNVGKFEDLDSPVDLGKLTLIYAENGRGKSTLADTFRSLCTGKTDRVLGRKTHNSDNSPYLELSLKNGDSISFNSDKWVVSMGGVFETDDIYVFDDVFINENVYSGNTIDTPHRRNLASLIIGDTAVRFQEREDALRDSVKVREKKIERLERDIAEQIHPFRNNPSDKPSVTDFARLPVIPGIDTELEEQKQLVRQLKESDTICKNKDFDKLPIPKLPVDLLNDMLQETLPDIEKNAERRVKEHLQQFVFDDMEDWLDTGTKNLDPHAEFCPYCGQRLIPGHLIEHYQSYFNEEYMALKSRMTNFPNQYLDYDEQLADLNKTLQNNSNSSETWKKELPDISINVLTYQQIAVSLKTSTDLIRDTVIKKSNAPLEIIEFDAKAHRAIENWNQMVSKIDNYNREVAKANQKILYLKEKLRSGNLEEAERSEQLLRNTKRRHDDPVVSKSCGKYIAETNELESEKTAIKKTRIAKDRAIAELFKTHQDSINKYLGSDYFDLEFSLCDFDFTRDKAGERVEAFAIKFPVGIIPIGSADTTHAESTFKNTMSAGDRSALSLAVFLAHLDSIEDIASKVIVIDDPITSMDSTRRWATYEAIREFCDKNCQVIVLSHSAEFLHLVWDEYGRRFGRAQTTRRLWIRPTEGMVHASAIDPEWDSESFLMNRHRKRIRRVEEFAVGVQDDPEDVGKCLRQILEHHYKDLYPNEYSSKIRNFGNFVDCVASAQPGDVLYSLKMKSLDKLKNANVFMRRLHHDSEGQRPKEAELRSRCKGLLKLIRGEPVNDKQALSMLNSPP